MLPRIKWEHSCNYRSRFTARWFTWVQFDMSHLLQAIYRHFVADGCSCVSISRLAQTIHIVIGERDETRIIDKRSRRSPQCYLESHLMTFIWVKKPQCDPDAIITSLTRVDDKEQSLPAGAEAKSECLTKWLGSLHLRRTSWHCAFWMWSLTYFEW